VLAKTTLHYAEFEPLKLTLTVKENTLEARAGAVLPQSDRFAGKIPVRRGRLSRG
jgi:hypothetical protein